MELKEPIYSGLKAILKIVNSWLLMKFFNFSRNISCGVL